MPELHIVPVLSSTREEVFKLTGSGDAFVFEPFYQDLYNMTVTWNRSKSKGDVEILMGTLQYERMVRTVRMGGKKKRVARVSDEALLEATEDVKKGMRVFLFARMKGPGTATNLRLHFDVRARLLKPLALPWYANKKYSVDLLR